MERIFTEADVDAAYIAVPNSRHRELVERCAQAGVHVICEKPMATSASDCERMIRACDENDVRLMVAYRLHFESANLRAIQVASTGRVGELRFFSSTFGQQVREGDIRTQADLGGGALFDMGIYCVNAARNLFRAEPEEVYAVQLSGRDARANGVDETTTAILRFSDNRIAQITASLGSADVDEYRIVGTKGDLRVEPAYTYVEERMHHLTLDGNTKTEKFPRSDQFAPELLHFAECIDTGDDPEPSGEEGLADVRVLEAIITSARDRRPVKLEAFSRSERPGPYLEMRKPPVKKPQTVHAPSPSK
jgi:predicted dehydrogenase